MLTKMDFLMWFVRLWLQGSMSLLGAVLRKQILNAMPVLQHEIRLFFDAHERTCALRTM